MSTSRRRFLALGSSALCSLSPSATAAYGSAMSLPQAHAPAGMPTPAVATPAVPRVHLPRHVPFDVALPVPRTRARAFGERRDHRHAAPARRARAP